MSENPDVEASRPYLTVVIPAYNEANRLLRTLDRLSTYLSRQSYQWEIIVVSNGSTDGTEELVRQISSRVDSLHLVALQERGKGLAVRAGVMQSRGEVVFLCDADLSMPPESLAGFLSAIQEADVVIGSREAPGARRFDEPWFRHAIGRIFNWLIKRLAVPGIEDTQCGFKAFRRTVTQVVFPRQILKGFAYDVETLYLARKAGFSVREYPIDWHFDPDTRVRPGIDSLHMIFEVGKMRARDLLGQYDVPLQPSRSYKEHDG